MRKIFFLILLFCINFPLFGTPSWEPPSLHNGQLRIDGQLYKRFSLGRLNGSPEFSFPIYLEHNISKYPYGELENFSQWTVPQLMSYVAPMNGGIFWLSPGGEEYFFKSNNPRYKVVSTRPGKLKDPYVAVQGNSQKEPDRIYIISKDRFIYAYDKGILKSLEAPSGRRMYFKSNGIRITGIEQREGGDTIPLLSAEYDALNRLVKLSIGPVFHEFSYDGESEILTEWRPFNMHERKVGFFYENGLISKIEYPNTYREKFSWTTDKQVFEASGFFYPDNEKFKPVLLSDSDNIYTYGQKNSEIIIQKANLLEKSDQIRFNPITNRLTVVDKGGFSSTVVWGRGFQNEATGKLSEIISPKGEIIVKLEYDEEGRISQMTRKGEKPIKYTYDEMDRITEIQNGDYPPTKYSYDGNSMRPEKITNPLGETKFFSYRIDGQIETYKNAAGATQKYSYNALGRITRRNYPMGAWISWSYDRFGRVIERNYSNGNSIKFEYNELNQIKKVVENNNVTWRYIYHPSGKIKRIVRNGDIWLEVSAEIKNEKEYLSIVNHKGAERSLTYSVDGKLLEEVNPLQDTIQYKYDPVGHLTGWTAPDGSNVKFAYDARGEMVFHENHIGQTLERKFNESGNIIEKKTKEQTLKIKYDEFDRVIENDYSNNQITAVKYDGYGRIIEGVSGGTKIELEYDALGRHTKRIMTYSDGSKTATLIEYTKTGKRRKITTMHQKSESELEKNIVEYAYDELNRPKEIAINNSLKISYIYDKKSQMLVGKTFTKGNKNTYSYDEFSRLKTILNYDSSGKLASGVSYDWDTDGTLKGKKVWKARNKGLSTEK